MEYCNVDEDHNMIEDASAASRILLCDHAKVPIVSRAKRDGSDSEDPQCAGNAIPGFVSLQIQKEPRLGLGGFRISGWGCRMMFA